MELGYPSSVLKEEKHFLQLRGVEVVDGSERH